ncbi:MAG: hypothetical protein IJE45_04565 [Bacilli bacterium]|nr:hypothetical protein [Bacilli bacterium]
MKYQMEIEKISLAEKVSLIKGYDSWKNSYVAFIKDLNTHISNFYVVSEKLERYGLTLVSLIATWDRELQKKSLQSIFMELKGEGVNAVILEDSILSELNISNYVREQFINCFIECLQSVGIYVFVTATSQEQVIKFDSAYGYLIDPVNKSKIKTERPLLVNKNGTYFVYCSDIQLLSDDEIIRKNRAFYDGEKTNTISNKEIDTVLDTMIDVANTISQPSQNIPEKNEEALKLLYQQSVVIFKNEKATLPLQKDKRYILISSRDVQELETYIIRQGFQCKSISVGQNVRLSSEELNGYDAAIVFAIDDNLLGGVCETVKNKLLDLIVIQSSKEVYDYQYLSLSDAFIDMFASGTYRQFQIKKILTGELVSLGYSPFKLEGDNILEATCASIDKFIQIGNPQIVNNELVFECNNTSSFEESELIVVKNQDTSNIVGFRRVHLAPYEKKKYRVNLGGELCKYNTSMNKFTIVNGKYNLVFNDDEKAFVLNVTNAQLSLVEKAQQVQTTTNNKFKLPVKKVRADKKVIGLFNIVVILDILFMILVLADVWSYVFGAILLTLNLVLLVVFDVFAKRNDGLAKRIVKSKDKPVPFDEIFNVKPERVVKEKTEEVTEEVIDVDAAEIDLDKVDSSITVSEQEKVIAYLKEKIDINELINDIKLYLNENGFDVENKTIKNIVAAMASTHTVLFKSQNNEVSGQFIDIFSRYFNNNSYVKDITEEITKESELLKDSKLIQTLKYSMLEPDNISVFGFNNLKAIHFEELISSFVPFIYNFRNKTKISETVTLDKNSWMFGLIAEDELIYNIPSEISKVSIVITLDVRQIPTSEKTEHQKINYYQFMKLVNDCKNTFFLEESEWKKIDALESYVNGIEPFVLGNKVNSQIEAFTAVLVSTNVDVADSLDLVIAEKVLPIIVPIVQNASNKPEVSLVEKIEEIFGDSNITLTLRNIKNIQMG